MLRIFSTPKKIPANLFSWLFIFLVPLFFWFHNRIYTGPAYLADEIGYLANASFLGGHWVDGASSYHAGYSIFITPVFWLFDRPSEIWRGAMVVNAVLWSGSFFLLHRLLIICCPTLSLGNKLITLFISMLYPTWLTMSGYVFVTSAFVFVFMASMVTLAQWRQGTTISLVPHSLLVGYLYWIHPTGIGVILASGLAVGLIAYQTKSYRDWFVHMLLMVILVFFYKKGVHDYLSIAMTPEGYVAFEHYPSMVAILAKMGNLSFWAACCVRVFGQFFYMIIGTFGLVTYGVAASVHQSLKWISQDGNSAVDLVRLAIAVYLILSLIFVMGIGAIMFSAYDTGQIDEWIFGRYIDHLLMPLLAFGVVALIHLTTLYRVAIVAIIMVILLFTGFLIQLLAVTSGGNNLINTPAFWPQYLQISPNFIQWSLIGLGGVILVGVGGKYVALILMVISFFYSSSAQDYWHKGIQSNYSNPSSLVEMVRQGYPAGSCVAFDPDIPADASLFQKERFNLYKFYFFNYRYQRMTPTVWLNNCDGPLLTYNGLSLAKNTQFRVIARERVSGLFLVAKNNEKKLNVSTAIANAADIIYASWESEYCLLSKWCLAISGPELMRFTEVGKLDGTVLTSAQQAGYLFYGPYQPIRQGSYYLMIRGNFRIEECAVFDITSHSSSVKHGEATLCGNRCEQAIVIPFELASDVEDIEVRLKVTASDFITVSGYQVISAEQYSLSNRAASDKWFCADAAFNPIQ